MLPLQYVQISFGQLRAIAGFSVISRTITPRAIVCGCFLTLNIFFLCGLSILLNSSLAYGKNNLGGFPQSFGDSMSPHEPAPFAPMDTMVPKDAPSLEMLELLTQGGMDKLPPNVREFLMKNKGTEPLPLLVAPLQITNERTVYSDKTSALAKVPKPKVPGARDPFVFGTIIPGMEPIFKPFMSFNSLPTPRPNVNFAGKVQNPQDPQVKKTSGTTQDKNSKAANPAANSAVQTHTGTGSSPTLTQGKQLELKSAEGKSLKRSRDVQKNTVEEKPENVIGNVTGSANISGNASNTPPEKEIGQNKKVYGKNNASSIKNEGDQNKKRNENISLNNIRQNNLAKKEPTKKEPTKKAPVKKVLPKEDLLGVLSKLNLNDLRLRAEAGDAGAQHKLGLAYYDGIDVAKNKEEALKWIKKSAATDHLPAFVSMGKLWETGYFGNKNPGNAGIWYKKAADKGFADGFYHLALLYDTEKLGTGNSAKRFAMEYYRQAGNREHPQALYNLALFYDTDQDATRDMGQAVKLYRSSAHLGYALAQLQVGLLYESGKILPKNATLASTWYNKAAMQGLAEAQYLLAGMYQKGQGIPKDLEKAVQLYKAAATQGFVDAQVDLGLLYIVGEGSFHDENKGKEWLKKAAAQGDEQASEILLDL